MLRFSGHRSAAGGKCAPWRMPLRVVIVTVLSLIGSAAIVIAADHLLFVRGTWSGWRLALEVANHDDATWWQSCVGTIPLSRRDATFVAPATISGLDSANGDSYPTPETGPRPFGLNAYRLRASSSFIHGGVLISPDTHAWRIVVNLPGGPVLERTYLAQPGQTPLHPIIGGWQVKVLPVGLLLNTLLFAAPLAILVIAGSRVWFRICDSVRGALRRARGQCRSCRYELLEGQAICPECGEGGFGQRRVDQHSNGAAGASRRLVRRASWPIVVLLTSFFLVLFGDLALFYRESQATWSLESYLPVSNDQAWWRAEVGEGTESQSGSGAPPPEIHLLHNPSPVQVGAGGLRGYSIEPSSGRLRGKLLVSPVASAWRVGVELPGGMAVERTFVMVAGQVPTMPPLLTWNHRILPAGLVLNSLLLAGPLAALLTLTRLVRRRSTLARGQRAV